MNIIGVIGAGRSSLEMYEQARTIGAAIANMGGVLVCGGLEIGRAHV